MIIQCVGNCINAVFLGVALRANVWDKKRAEVGIECLNHNLDSIVIENDKRSYAYLNSRMITITLYFQSLNMALRRLHIGVAWIFWLQEVQVGFLELNSLRETPGSYAPRTTVGKLPNHCLNVAPKLKFKSDKSLRWGEENVIYSSEIADIESLRTQERRMSFLSNQRGSFVNWIFNSQLPELISL